MELLLGDCLELLPEIKDDSVDLLFCDLPWGATSCKWDCLIDLEKFWKDVNRVCKIDTPMLFTCSVKFGNTLINSNPKNFRYDLIWVKSAAVGFLNAKKMPMKKHEMVYVFYRKLPKIYTENISLHHSHKFIKETENKDYENRTIKKRNTIKKEENYGKEYLNKKVNYRKYDPTLGGKPESHIYDPPLPNSVIKENKDEEFCKYDVNKNCYGGGREGRIKVSKDKKDHQQKYDPPLPNSVIKNTNKHSEIYGEIEGNGYTSQERKTNVYDPPLPSSVIKDEDGVVNEEYDSLYGELKQPEWICDNIERNKLRRQRKKEGKSGSAYDPPLPISVIKDEDVFIRGKKKKTKEDVYNYDERLNNGKLYHHSRKMQKGDDPIYDPPLPNSLLECKSEKGKHSTQKPVTLMEWILKYYSREGGLVLDPTMGSGSMGVACKNMKRQFIGIEKDDKIFEVAMERLHIEN